MRTVFVGCGGGATGGGNLERSIDNDILGDNLRLDGVEEPERGVKALFCGSVGESIVFNLNVYRVVFSG